MQVGHVRMGMAQRCVPVRVAVRACGHGFVRVVVVAIVVAVAMSVRLRQMAVLVQVR